MMFNPHKLGIHKVLKHIPLNAVFDAPYKRAVKKAVNIADLRLIAKSRAHKVRQPGPVVTGVVGCAQRSVRIAYTNAAAFLLLAAVDGV
jgi:hypothetical protein